MNAADVMRRIDRAGNANDAKFLQTFFRTGPGEYGEGDRFVGVRVPVLRRIAKDGAELPLAEVQRLLDSPTHEHRAVGLFILAHAFARGDAKARERIHRLYLRNVKRGRVNNWDLVDASAGALVGAHLVDRPRELLFTMAKSKSMWERRVAIVATMPLLRAGDADTTFALAELLRNDPHDLMHKAVGWLLREAGKRVSRPRLRTFLQTYGHELPRTMLRYALEHFPPEERAQLMALKAERAKTPVSRSGTRRGPSPSSSRGRR